MEYNESQKVQYCGKILGNRSMDSIKLKEDLSLPTLEIY